MDRTGWVLCVALLGAGLGSYGAISSRRLASELADVRRLAAQYSASPFGKSKVANWSTFDFERVMDMPWGHGRQLEDIEPRIRALQEGTCPAVLNASQRGFDLAKTPYGAFPVSIEDAKPYLDGFAVTFNVGNPLGASVTGATMEINYGPDFDDLIGPKKNLDMEEWSRRAKRERKVSHTIVEALKEGRWSRVRVVLSPAEATDLGRIELKLNISGLAMGKPPTED